jgi:hypothetical protein
MKILFVHGDDDYAALQWEQLNQEKTDKIILKFTTNPTGRIEFADGCYVELKEFGNIDEKFIEFLFDEMLDYDSCKHVNFYIL